VRFTPDGEQIAFTDESDVLLWNFGTEVVILVAWGQGIDHLTFSPDGKLLAFAMTSVAKDGVHIESSANVRIVNVASRETERTFDVKGDGKLPASQATLFLSLTGMVGPLTWVSSLVFAPDGRSLAAAVNDGTVHVWDVKSGKERAVIRGHTQPISAIAFSPDGQRLITAGLDATIKVWDAARGQEILSLRGHAGPVLDMAFDGQRIVSGGSDGTLRVWDGRPQGAEK
jgi:WD40 repeat protein